MVAPHEAVARFVDWLRDGDFSGWHTAGDIGEFYRWFCADEGIEEMPEAAMRERFAALPGVDKGRRRIQHSTEKQLVRIRRRTKGEEKPMLYRVASHEEAAEALALKRQQRSKPKAQKADSEKAPPMKRAA